MNHQSTIEYGIIGLGRFGTALAKTLAEAGREVLVLDNNENKVKDIREVTQHAFVVDHLDKNVLEEAGIQNCETVIICIGEKIDVSILTTMNVISMGVPRVIAKALSFEQGAVLEKLGAEVIYPESDMAIRLANRLIAPSALDFMELNDDITVAELKLSSKISGQTIVQANIRKRFHLNIIALERAGKTTIEVNPDTALSAEDALVVIGKQENIHKFEAYLAARR